MTPEQRPDEGREGAVGTSQADRRANAKALGQLWLVCLRNTQEVKIGVGVRVEEMRLGSQRWVWGQGVTQSDQSCTFIGPPFWLLQGEGKQGHQLGGYCRHPGGDKQ